MVKEGVAKLSDDGLTPVKQLEKDRAMRRELIVDQQRVWMSLKSELAENGISVISPGGSERHRQAVLDTQFHEQIFRS